MTLLCSVCVIRVWRAKDCYGTTRPSRVVTLTCANFLTTQDFTRVATRTSVCPVQSSHLQSLSTMRFKQLPDRFSSLEVDSSRLTATPDGADPAHQTPVACNDTQPSTGCFETLDNNLMELQTSLFALFPSDTSVHSPKPPSYFFVPSATCGRKVHCAPLAPTCNDELPRRVL